MFFFDPTPLLVLQADILRMKCEQEEHVLDAARYAMAGHLDDERRFQGAKDVTPERARWGAQVEYQKLLPGKLEPLDNP